MESELSGRAIAITGASSGIGAACARVLAGAGASVALGARRADRLDELAGQIEAAGGTAVAIEADIAKEEEAGAFVRQAHERLGRLDGLVNNAGVMLLGPVTDADTGQWRQMVDVNVLGLLYCTHAALPLMRDGGGGHIVNISSVAGRVASLGSAVYNLTKWGVGGFSEGLRQEALHMGIRVTLIEPGYVETELQGHNTHPAVLAGLQKMREEVEQPLSADDIARGVLYALSQPAHVAVNEVLIRPSKQRR